MIWLRVADTAQTPPVSRQAQPARAIHVVRRSLPCTYGPQADLLGEPPSMRRRDYTAPNGRCPAALLEAGRYARGNAPVRGLTAVLLEYAANR